MANDDGDGLNRGRRRLLMAAALLKGFAMVCRASATGGAPGLVGMGRGLPRRCAPVLLAVALGGSTAGCALDTRSPLLGLSVTLTAPIAIPSQQAHAVLQNGRLANAGNRLDSWCELEVRTLSGAAPRMITRGHFHVSRVTSRLLLDPTTRIPVIFAATSCSDPLFQEELWWLSSTEPSDVMYLRCIAPYYHCAFGPPLSPAQVQQQVGPYLTIRPDDPPPADGFRSLGTGRR